jgi:hypothetical protein
MSDDDVDPPRPPPKHRRELALALAAVSICALAFAAFTKQWLVREDEVGFGLTSVRVCGMHDVCDTVSNGELVKLLKGNPDDPAYTSGAFEPMGWATFVEIFVAIAGLAAAAVIAAARKQPQLPIAPSTVAFIVTALALITACIFVATKPGGSTFVAVGPSFWVFGGGVITGIVASQLLARVNRPDDPDLMADTMNPDEY